MAHPQVSKGAGSGITLTRSAHKKGKSSETSKVMEAPQPNSIDEQGAECIRRLDKAIGTNPKQRAEDQKFIEMNFGEFSPSEMHAMFASSESSVCHALMRRRLEREKSRS